MRVALAEARHPDRDLPQVPGPVEGGDDQRDRPVGFQAAVVQPERLADPPGGQVAVHVDGLALHRVRVGGGMPPEGDRDLPEVLVGGAVHVLVALREHGDPHRRDDVPVQRGELHVAPHRQGRPVTAAVAVAGPAVERPEHHHHVAGARADGTERLADDGDREVAAALQVHRQPQVDRADRPRHVRAGVRVAGAEVDDPVHVGRPQAGVVQRGPRRLGRHGQRGAAGALAERRPADSGDRCLAHCHDLPRSTTNG